MEKFRKEYEKMHRAWKTSYDSEKRLVRRCKELNDTILQNAVKVKGAIKLTQDDSSTIAMLRKEVEKCWKLVEQAKEKEEKARKIITDLKEEIAKLHKIVEDGSGLSLGSDNQLSQMMKREELLTREVKEKADKIDELELNKTSLDARIANLLAQLHQEKELVQTKNHENEVLKEDQAKQKRQEKFFQEKEQKLTKEKDKIISDLDDMTTKFNNKDNENQKLEKHFLDTQ
jgi:chromosome segregation ATPase